MKPVERTTLWDQAYAELRQALLAGRFSSDDRIVLRDIAAELKISLTPVRDAVNRLIAEGILERGSSGHGGGAIVPRITKTQFDELVLIRCDLEGRAASRAAEFATKQSLTTLQDLLKRMKVLIREKNLQDYLAVHRQFHFTIYAESGMPVLQQMIENILLRCGPVLNYVIPHYVLLLKGTDLHVAIVDAIARRDCRAANSAIRQDIIDAGRYISDLADHDGQIIPPLAKINIIGPPKAKPKFDKPAKAVRQT